MAAGLGGLGEPSHPGKRNAVLSTLLVSAWRLRPSSCTARSGLRSPRCNPIPFWKRDGRERFQVFAMLVNCGLKFNEELLNLRVGLRGQKLGAQFADSLLSCHHGMLPLEA